MPFKYIGRTHDFRGKTLWEIVGNLKNLGVGRIVARNILERYPEPSYIKILKVETLSSPKEETLDNLRKVRVLAERTFRGQTYPKPILIESTSYKTDYKLIPKDEEDNYCQRNKSKETDRILPKTMPLPPILKELLLRDLKGKKGESDKEFQLEIVYNKNSLKKKYRIAKEGEKPNIHIDMSLGKPVSPNLYEDIQIN